MHSFLSKCPPMKSEIEYFKLYKMQEKISKETPQDLVCLWCWDFF